MRRLSALYLHGNPLIGDEGVELLSELLLAGGSVSENVQEDERPAAAGEVGPRLTLLNLGQCGVGDRGASIRVPVSVEGNNWTGYLEDRRPASNCDPYKVAMRIIQTVERLPDA